MCNSVQVKFQNEYNCVFEQFPNFLNFIQKIRTRTRRHDDGENKEGRRDEKEEGTGRQFNSRTNKRAGKLNFYGLYSCVLEMQFIFIMNTVYPPFLHELHKICDNGENV